MDGAVERTLQLADYLVITATLLVSASIGVYFRLSGGRQKTTKEYLLGDRDQSMIPVAFSLMASFMSAITLLGVSSEVYIFGTIFFIINFGYVVFAPIAVYLYLPVFFKLETTSAYESLLMFAAVLSVIFTAVLDKGSLQAIWQIGVDGGRINFNNTDLDPTVRHSILSLLIGGGFTFMSLYAVNQTQVQRYLTMKDLKTAVRSLWLSIIILLLLSGLTCFSGLAIYSKYYGCDPVLSGRIQRKDQLLPLFVVETMGDIPGLSGLFVAGIFSASLSTVSACLNSLAAVTLEDYVKPLYRLWTDSEIPTSRCAFISKLLALTYGVVCLAMAFLSQLLGGVLQAALSIFGMVGGPIFGVFSLGLFFPFANEPGALAGLLTGLALALVMGFGGPKPPNFPLPLRTDSCPASESSTTLLTALASNVTTTGQSKEYFYLFRVSYLYYIVISFAVTLLVGLVVSCLISTRCRPSKDLNPDLFVPPLANYLRRKKLEREIELNNQEKRENDSHNFSIHL